MSARPDDVLVPDVGRYIATKHYRVHVTLYRGGETLTYTALFACIPCLDGVVAMLRNVANRMADKGTEMTEKGFHEVTTALQSRVDGYRQMARLIMKVHSWPASIHRTGCGLVNMPNASLSVTEDYSWSLHNA